MIGDLGKLRVRLGLENAEFREGLKQSRIDVGQFGKALAVGLAGAAATAAGALAVLGVRQLSVIDAQAKMARSLGTTTASMQTLERAGELAGLQMSQIEQGAKDLFRRLSQAADGTGPAVAALDRLGLSARDLLALPLDKRIETINQAINDFVPAAARAAVAGQFFGEEGSLAISRLDPATLALAASEMRNFGGAVSDVDAAKIEEANDAISRIKLAFTGLGNQAAVILAPALTAVADALSWLIDRRSEFERATDNNTMAMGDEIRQINQLLAVQGQGGVMTVDLARDKLDQAESHLAAAAAIRNETQAMVDQRVAVLEIDRQYREEALAAIAPIGTDLEKVPLQLREAYLEAEKSLADIVTRQMALRAVSEESNKSFANASAEVERLRAAIANAENGVVQFDGAVIEGVALTERLAAATGSIDFSNGLAGARALSAQMQISLNQAMRLMGLIGAAAQAKNDPVIFDPRDPRYNAEAAAAGRAAADRAAYLDRVRENMAALTAETEAAAAANVVLEKATVGGGGGGSAGALTETAEAADTATDAFEDMRMKGLNGLSGAIGNLFGSGLRDWKAFFQSVWQIARQTLVDVVTMWAKVRLAPSFGIDLSGNGQAATGGSGVLSSIGGKAFGSLGSGLMSATPTFGSGLLGGLGSTVSATIGSGGGLGGLFSIGSNAAAAGGGIMATIGAALPVVGIVAGLFSLFNRKPPISAADLRLIQEAVESTGNLTEISATAGAALKKLAGGVKEFGQVAQTYSANFLTADERRTQAIAGLQDQFDKLGLQMPATARGFRDLVEGLDLTTKTGREAYVSLLGMSGSFAQIFGGIESTAADLAGRFGGAMFANWVDEARVNAAIAAGVEVSYFQAGGGIVRPDQLYSLNADSASPEESLAALLSTARGIASLDRIFERWERFGMPPTRT